MSLAPGSSCTYLALGALALCSALACGDHASPAPARYLDRAAMLDPATCQSCHPSHVREWSGSMHAYASDDPVFVAMNARGQRETNGALGDFCVKCHAPMALREGATTDGLNLATVPAALKGVTCLFCHSVSSVEGAHDAAVTLSPDLVMRGEYPDPVSNVAHASAYSPLHDRDHLQSAGLCGACHDVVAPAGAAIERTYAEWQGSVFAHGSGGATCGQCHTAQSTVAVPIATGPGISAPPRRTHAHDFPAVDVALTSGFPNADTQRQAVQDLLRTTLQTALCVTQQGGVRVLVDNVAAGHAWPSGSAQDRRAWAEVIASSAGNVVYQSGVVADGESVVTVQNDPDRWLLRDCMFDAQSRPVSMFWLAASTEANELPVQVTNVLTDPRYYRTHLVQRFPRALNAVVSPYPDKVTLRIRLQPIGLDVLGDLVASHDLDPTVLSEMPTWDVTQPLEWSPQTATLTYLEGGVTVTCVSSTNFNVGADKVAATGHAMCSP